MFKNFSFLDKIFGLKNKDKNTDKQALEKNENQTQAKFNMENKNNNQNEFLQDQNRHQSATDDDWADDKYEGQLSVDVFQTPSAIVIKSAVAGVKPENLDISINNDLVTIRGSRYLAEKINNEDYFYQECYWGDFSRSIVLPIECQADKAEAIFKNGILTIKMPKADKAKKISVQIMEE